MKKAIRIMMVIVLVISVLGLGAVAEGLRRDIVAVETKDMYLSYNGDEFLARDANENVVYPIVVDGTSYLPTRAVCAIANLKVDWDDTTRTILLTSSDNTGDSMETEINSTEEDVDTADNTWRLIIRARQVLSALRDKDYEAFEQYVSSDGYVVAPYSHVYDYDLGTIQIDKGETYDLLTSEEVLTWGAYDGSGDPIELTPEAYFNEFIYSADFLNAPKIWTNEGLSHYVTDVVMTGGHAKDNVDAYVVFKFEGFDEAYEGMDWQSIRIFFEEVDGTYYVVAIAHGCWTI